MLVTIAMAAYMAFMIMITVHGTASLFTQDEESKTTMELFHKDGTCNYCFIHCNCPATDTWVATDGSNIMCDCCGASEPLTAGDVKVLMTNAKPPEKD